MEPGCKRTIHDYEKIIEHDIMHGIDWYCGIATIPQVENSFIEKYLQAAIFGSHHDRAPRPPVDCHRVPSGPSGTVQIHQCSGK